MKRQLAAILVCSFAAAGAYAEPGVTPTSVKLGQSAPMTGPAAALGTEMRVGAKAYFDYVNAHGGVHGRTIDLDSMDDGYEPGRTEANTKQLIDGDKVFGLFGYVGTPTSLAVMPIVTAGKVPFVAPFTGAEALRKGDNPYIFHVRASYYDETEEIVRFIVDGNQRRVAVFYQDDAFGQAGLTGVQRALTKRNLETVATGTVKRNTIDVASAVQGIVAAHADAVVMISAYTSCAEFVREAKKAGYTGRYYSVSFVGAKALAEELGDDSYGVIVSQVVPLPWDLTIPVVKDYQRLMMKSGYKTYSFTSFEGYLAARVVAEALDAAGPDLTRDKFLTALERIKSDDLGGFFVNFNNPTHVGSNFVELTMIGHEGKFIR
jgi:branched-chain amino acid transport system substrate-binding protein